MKIISTVIIFLNLVVCGNSSAASAYYWLSYSSSGYQQENYYTNLEVRGLPGINEYSRFNSTWGNLTGVTILTSIHGDFVVAELLSTDLIDYSAPLTVIGSFSAGNSYYEYNDYFNIQVIGVANYSVNKSMSNLIPEIDWSGFIHYPNTPPMGIISRGSHHSTLDIDIISLNSSGKKFVGMTVWEDTIVKYDYDESPLVAGIPEPGSYALMLIGLGALGFSARRRKTL